VSANNAASLAGIYATSANAALSALNARISYGTAAPTGGSDGDIYFQYV
jgi:hypothetical protein